MLLRLYGFNFAISLAYTSQGFFLFFLLFSLVNSKPVGQRPKMASRFIGELCCDPSQSKNITQQQLLQQLTGSLFATTYAHPNVKVCSD